MAKGALSVLVKKCALTTPFPAQLLKLSWTGMWQGILAPLMTTLPAATIEYTGFVTDVAMSGRPASGIVCNLKLVVHIVLA